MKKADHIFFYGYDDGFDYLSCMLALKLKDKETNKRLQKVSD